MKGFNKEIYRLLCGIVIAVVVVVEVIVMAVIVVGSQQQMASSLLSLLLSRTNHGWSITSTHTHPIYQYDPINRLWIQIKQQIDIFVKETQSTAKTVRENDRRRGGGGGGTIRGRRKRGMRYRASLQWMFQVKIGMKTPSIRIMMTVMLMLMLTVMIVAVIVLMMLLVMLLIVMRKRVGRWIGPSLLLLLLLRPLEFHTVHTGTGSGHVGSLDTGA